VAENKSFTDRLQEAAPKKPAPPPAPIENEDQEEDVGPCAAIAKNKWVSALTLKHSKKPWESFQYRHMAVRSTFEPTRFEVLFVGDHDKWRVVVTGRNLERIYNLVIQHRLEWIRPAERDFGDESLGCVTSAEASIVADDYSPATEEEARAQELSKGLKRPRGTESSQGR